MFPGLPGGSSGGGPITPAGFWLLIGLTGIAVGALVVFLTRSVGPLL